MKAPYVFEDTTWPGHCALLGALIFVCAVIVNVVIPGFVTFVVIAKAATVHLQNNRNHPMYHTKESVISINSQHKKNQTTKKSSLWFVYIIYTMNHFNKKSTVYLISFQTNNIVYKKLRYTLCTRSNVIRNSLKLKLRYLQGHRCTKTVNTYTLLIYQNSRESSQWNN